MSFKSMRYNVDTLILDIVIPLWHQKLERKNVLTNINHLYCAIW